MPLADLFAGDRVETFIDDRVEPVALLGDMPFMTD
jgi:hypothetical protein